MNLTNPTQNTYIQARNPMREALQRLNQLPIGTQLFVLDQQQRLIGTLSDRDIRNGLLRNLQLEDPVARFMNPDFPFITESNLSEDQMAAFRATGLQLLPLLDAGHQIIELIDLAAQKAVLPVEALIMAGGQGKRLKPYTDEIPKPLLPLGDKSIIEYLLDLLQSYGIRQVHLCTRYQNEQISHRLRNYSKGDFRLHFHVEQQALGTIGGARLIDNWEQNDLLILNADLLTNIDLDRFYRTFQESNADMAVASTRFEFQVPYAVLETHYGEVYGIEEKPKLSYQTNAGIYLLRRSELTQIPEGQFFNATDLISKLIAQNKKVISVPLNGYWLDIGTPEDYRKAQEDIRHLQIREL